MQYIALIQGNAARKSTPAEWESFFEAARRSGMFRGGSAMGDAVRIGDPAPPNCAQAIVGYMRFDATDIEPLRELLATHPVIQNGGSIDLCTMPRS